MMEICGFVLDIIANYSYAIIFYISHSVSLLYAQVLYADWIVILDTDSQQNFQLALSLWVHMEFTFRWWGYKNKKIDLPFW